MKVGLEEMEKAFLKRLQTVLGLFYVEKANRRAMAKMKRWKGAGRL